MNDHSSWEIVRAFFRQRELVADVRAEGKISYDLANMPAKLTRDLTCAAT